MLKLWAWHQLVRRPGQALTYSSPVIHKTKPSTRWGVEELLPWIHHLRGTQHHAIVAGGDRSNAKDSAMPIEHSHCSTDEVLSADPIVIEEAGKVGLTVAIPPPVYVRKLRRFRLGNLNGGLRVLVSNALEDHGDGRW